MKKKGPKAPKRRKSPSVRLRIAAIVTVSAAVFLVGGVHSDFTPEILRRFIDKEKPDPVVPCGDNVTPDKEDLRLQKAIRDLFDEKKVYRTFVLGNHDGEATMDETEEDEVRKHVYETMLGSPCCLARDEETAFSATGITS